MEPTRLPLGVIMSSSARLIWLVGPTKCLTKTAESSVLRTSNRGVLDHCNLSQDPLCSGLGAGMLLLWPWTSNCFDSFGQFGLTVAAGNCLPLPALALFVWLMIGASVGLVIHYWTKDRV
jgi:hypothetical protein